MRINGHGHILPEPHQVPRFMKEKKLFWIDEDKKFMRQGDWSRPIAGPGFFIKDKLAWMDKKNIDHSVMLCLSQLYCNGWEKKHCFDAIRFQNDFNASIQNNYPKKFTCGFVVQPRYMDHALNEIDRCVNELGLKLICLPTHFLNSRGEWLSIAEPEVNPIFELANKHGLAMQVHPYDGEKMTNLKNKYWRFHLVWMMAQCADTLHLFTLRNIPKKYPRIRTSFAHGGMLGAVNHGRRVHGFESRPDIFEKLHNPTNILGQKNLYFDTLVHDPHSLNLLKIRFGANQIIMGLDDPYPLGEVGDTNGAYPGRTLEQAIQMGYITEEEGANIWHKNILDWLGKKKEDFDKKNILL